MKRQITFKVLVGESETRDFTLKIPTGGQLVQIENLKAVYSTNNYQGIVQSGTVGANYALDLVDMNAYVSVLVPKLIEELKMKDLFELDIFDLQAVKTAYHEQMVPWINEWQTALRKLNSPSEDKK
jgi:hypothetical protein